MTEEQKQKRKLEILLELTKLKRLSLAYDNFDNFRFAYVPHLTPSTQPAFHKTIYNTLSVTATPTGPSRALVVAPRGFAKSTISSKIFPLYLSLTNKAKDIIIVSATVALAKEHLRTIRLELEGNERLLTDFGPQRNDEKWTEDHIILRNGCNIRAKGRGFQIRGFRPDFIICDDLEDDEVIYSKEQRDKMEQWFFRTLLPSLKPQQKLIYIGTILHQYSLINKLRSKKEFTQLFFKAITDGKSIWEELFPTTYLENLRDEMGVYAFEAEYQNNPISLEAQPVKPDMLEIPAPVTPSTVRCMSVDPAISEKSIADWTAITIFDKTEDNRFKEVYSERGHWGIDALIEKIIGIYQRYEPNRVLIEEVAYQKVIRYVLTEKARQRNIFIPVSVAEIGMSATGTDKRPKDKVTRLMQIVKLFEQKLVHISSDWLRQELLAFPFGDHDDGVDAMVYALYWLMKYQGGMVFKKEKINGIINTRPTLAIFEDKNGNWMARHEPPPKPNVLRTFINTLRGTSK